MKRRNFLRGCCAAAAASAVPMTGFFNLQAFAGSGQHSTFVFLFLRGGMDGLHLVVPYAGPERVAYEAKRVNGSVNLAIPEDRLRQISPLWALHPRFGGEKADLATVPGKWLHQLYQQNKLAIVQGAGISTLVNRSHFDAQAFMDLGIPGTLATPSGWITRYLQAASGLPPTILSSAFGLANNQPMSLRGSLDAIVINDGSSFSLDGFHSSWRNDNDSINGHSGASSQLDHLWSGSDLFHLPSGQLAEEALGFFRSVDFSGYVPEGGAEYPNSTLGTQLRNLAQLIKLEIGMVATTLDTGGWDNHVAIGMPQPGNPAHSDPYGDRIENLSRALHAFYRDLAGASQGNFMQRVNVVVMSEFGRRVRPNQSSGTDHGYGNVMLVLGDRVNGGLHGIFPGLDDDSLVQGQDIDVSTDYRQILSELLVRRHQFPSSSLDSVFPGLGGFQPVGVFQT